MSFCIDESVENEIAGLCDLCANFVTFSVKKGCFLGATLRLKALVAIKYRLLYLCLSCH